MWQAKIRSAWHNRLKAPLEVFFGPKPLWLDHRSKKGGLKNKTRKLFTKEKSFKKRGGGGGGGEKIKMCSMKIWDVA